MIVNMSLCACACVRACVRACVCFEARARCSHIYRYRHRHETVGAGVVVDSRQILAVDGGNQLFSFFSHKRKWTGKSMDALKN